jgi:3-dehydroquinate dehydratase-2
VKIAVIHGPNLALLGQREPEIYGTSTLDDIDHALADLGGTLGAEVESFQSNHEGELLDFLTRTAPAVAGFVVNAAALTHTSVALRDGLAAVGRPFVEVHLSNTAARERFRQRSLLAPLAVGVVYGFGPDSYLLGLRALVAHLTATQTDD